MLVLYQELGTASHQLVYKLDILQEILFNSPEQCTRLSLPPSAERSTPFNSASAGRTPGFWDTHPLQNFLGVVRNGSDSLPVCTSMYYRDDNDEEEHLWVISCTVLDHIFDEPSAGPTERYRQTYEIPDNRVAVSDHSGPLIWALPGGYAAYFNLTGNPRDGYEVLFKMVVFEVKGNTKVAPKEHTIELPAGVDPWLIHDVDFSHAWGVLGLSMINSTVYHISFV
jgi:hypothetical protein